jgi:Abnormal spindle-like microcephaly-assoc'd, ASPM-SPD-2-Hydin
MKSRVWYVTVFTLLIVFAHCGGGPTQHSISPTITTASLPNSTVETPYSQPIQASGGVAPFHWAVSAGALPNNVALNGSTTNTTTISGTPDTAAQGVAFTINVTDSANQSAAQAYTVSILLEPDTFTLSPLSLSFTPQLTGAVSGAQSETVTNTGSSPVLINRIALTGTNAADFSQSNTCVSSLAAGANCTISVTFTPSQFGPRSASITITDSTVGSPHSVSVNGIGLTSGPNATLSAASLTFATQLVGTTSPAQSITLTNYGTTTLNITSITATNFGETDTCAAGLASGASCTISVTFTPSATGSVTGTLSVADNALGTPQTVSLSGTGTTTTLTGRCWGEVQGTLQCQVATDLADCPAGQPAIPTLASGCVPPDSMLVDISRRCAFRTLTGALVRGECVVH